MSDSIRIVLVDDQELFRAGVRMLVDSQPDLKCVGQAGNGREAVAVVAETSPDVVLMDMRMPVLDGIQATQFIVDDFTARGLAPPRILVLTTFDLDEAAAQALRIGASGFLLKDSQPEFLLAAIRTVHLGNTVVAPGATTALFEHFAPPTADVLDVPGEFSLLTARETEIFHLASRGLSNTEIATHEYVSEATVKTHLSRVLAKLGLRDRVQLIVFAYEHGLNRRDQASG